MTASDISKKQTAGQHDQPVHRLQPVTVLLSTEVIVAAMAEVVVIVVAVVSNSVVAK